jgi:uncharacterized membrane protein
MVLLAKHVQHVVLIHFQIALFMAGALFDFLGQRTKHHLAAYYNFLAAAITTIPVVIARIVAWQWAFERDRLKGILLMHLVFGCLSGLLIWTV